LHLPKIILNIMNTVIKGITVYTYKYLLIPKHFHTTVLTMYQYKFQFTILPYHANNYLYTNFTLHFVKPTATHAVQ
jgi:hypothetical protein